MYGGGGGEDGGTEVDGGGAVEVEEGRVGGLGVGEVLRLGMIVVFGLWVVGGCDGARGERDTISAGRGAGGGGGVGWRRAHVI